MLQLTLIQATTRYGNQATRNITLDVYDFMRCVADSWDLSLWGGVNGYDHRCVSIIVSWLSVTPVVVGSLS